MGKNQLFSMINQGKLINSATRGHMSLRIIKCEGQHVCVCVCVCVYVGGDAYTDNWESLLMPSVCVRPVVVGVRSYIIKLLSQIY